MRKREWGRGRVGDRRRESGKEDREKERGKKGEWRIGRKNKREEMKRWKVAFWNVAGMGNKDKGFWKRLEEWDVTVLVKTWTVRDGRK